MKKMMFLVLMMTIAISANAMSYNKAKSEALFLSDKMAYELNLTDAQYDAVYEINLDYLMSVNHRDDTYGPWWNRRNADLRYVLSAWQYDKYISLSYFYRPLVWTAGDWIFSVYSHYTNRGLFYKAHPRVFVTYRGGHNRGPAHHYADFGRPHPAPGAGPGHGPTWRDTGRPGAPHGGPSGNDHGRGPGRGRR